MRRASEPQCRRRYRGQPDRLADEPASRLLEHQREIGETETETIHAMRDEDTQPPELSRKPQPRRREARISVAKLPRNLGTRCRDELRCAFPQQSLLRGEMQIHV